MSATSNCPKEVAREVELAKKVLLREVNLPVIYIIIDFHCVGRVVILSLTTGQKERQNICCVFCFTSDAVISENPK
jgi:hypothetical protein